MHGMLFGCTIFRQFFSSSKALEADLQSRALRRSREITCVSQRYMWSITWPRVFQDKASACKIDLGIRVYETVLRDPSLGLAIVK